VLRRDWKYYAFIGAYVLAVWLVAASAGRAEIFAPLVYAQGMLGYLVRLSPGIIAIFVAVVGVRALRSPVPVQALVGQLRGLASARLASDVALFIALLIFLGAFTSAKALLPLLVPFTADRFLANLDHSIHGQDPWRWLTALDPLTGPLQAAYGPLWLALLGLTPFLVCVLPGFRATRAQYLWTFLLAWPLLGNLVAALGSSAGPVFYERLSGDARFRPLTDHLQAANALQTSDWLWGLYTAGRGGLGSGISAFPSLHVAMATLYVLLGLRVDKRLAAVMFPYLCLVLVLSVHLGWHYAVDGYASILLTVGIWKVVGWVLARERQPAARAPALGEAMS
jgi:hypothetical protein